MRLGKKITPSICIRKLFLTSFNQAWGRRELVASSMLLPLPLFNDNIQTWVQRPLCACTSACTCCGTIVDSWQLSCEKGVHVIGWDDIKWTEGIITAWTSFLQRKCSLRSCLFYLVYSLWRAFRNSSDWTAPLCWKQQLHNMSLYYQGVKIK